MVSLIANNRQSHDINHKVQLLSEFVKNLTLAIMKIEAVN